jgi:hypothetical protein
MRKTIIDSAARESSPVAEGGMELERLGQVEVTSEDSEFPIESALVTGGGAGWRAGEPGAQTIRFVFDHPVRVRRILLRFNEDETARTQEFVLRWLPAGERAFREIVRQQFTFSPPATNVEAEDYAVELESATAIEIQIIPDISGGSARASLAQMSLF